MYYICDEKINIHINNKYRIIRAYIMIISIKLAQNFEIISRICIIKF